MVDLDAIPRIYCNADHNGVSVQAATPAQTARSYKPKRPSSSPRVVSSRSKDRQITTNGPPPSDRPQRKPAPTNRRPHTARLSRESGSRGATAAAWPNHVPLRSKRHQSQQQEEVPLATGTYFWKPASSAINKDWKGPRNLLLPVGIRISSWPPLLSFTVSALLAFVAAVSALTSTGALVEVACNGVRSFGNHK